MKINSYQNPHSSKYIVTKAHKRKKKDNRMQGRNQGRHQPASGHPLDSLKNKNRTIKKKLF
jgi:hypothetical protein